MSHPAIRDRARSVEVANEFRRLNTLSGYLDDCRDVRLDAAKEDDEKPEPKAA